MANFTVPATTGGFSTLLSKDYNKVFQDNYAKFEKEWTRIAKVENYTTNYVKESQVSDLTALRDITQGGQITFESPIQGNEKTVYFSKMGLGFQITEEMYDDDLTGIMKKMPAALARAANYTFEYKFWNLLNSGFVTTSYTIIDGGALFATHNLIGANGGTAVNYAATPTALSMTSLQAALNRGENMVDESGRPAPSRYNLLIVPPALRWKAAELIGSEYHPDKDATSGSFMTINPLKKEASGLNYMVCHYLTSNTAWFMVDTSMHDLRFMWRKKLAQESSDDFSTGNAMFKVTTRFQPTAFHYRCVDGNAGS